MLRVANSSLEALAWEKGAPACVEDVRFVRTLGWTTEAPKTDLTDLTDHTLTSVACGQHSAIKMQKLF
jgi:hypothetical protein